MSENIWERTVETYLATDRGLLLNPQYLVGESGGWESWIDFLAVEFPERHVWMVEVTKSPSDSLFRKIRTFSTDFAPRIRAQLGKHRVTHSTDSTDEWPIGLWIFVPKAYEATVEVRIKAAGVQPYKLTPLENTLDIAMPSYWEGRHR